MNAIKVDGIMGLRGRMAEGSRVRSTGRPGRISRRGPGVECPEVRQPKSRSRPGAKEPNGVDGFQRPRIRLKPFISLSKSTWRRGPNPAL
ncbi:hypothetical protein N9L19_00160 [bacterium]|nr:hypothetical protein [bacterium]